MREMPGLQAAAPVSPWCGLEIMKPAHSGGMTQTVKPDTGILPAHVAKFISALYPRKLLEPGWGGHLTDEEVAYIQFHLIRDDKLAFKWGFRPGQKSRPEEAIRRVAMHGDPDNRGANVTLARPRKGQN